MALAALSERMSGVVSAYQVQTAPRLAQWKVDSLSSATYRKSDPFKIGLWNWYLSVEKSKQIVIKLYPETSNLTRDQPPIASFVIKIVSSAGNRTTLVHPGVCDKQLKSNDDFIWAIDTLIAGKFVIDVEFLDLKTFSPSETGGGEPSSIWSFNDIKKISISAALKSFCQMLTDGIHTDITIKTTDGSIGAHRAILASRSPVFHGMFSHNLQEKENSTIHISDMSSDVCRALLNYVYGNVQAEEFMTHRLALLSAAEKYDVPDLKAACEESLVEDIDAKNVLERLRSAHLYKLPLLKRSCMRYLVGFGKIFQIHDEFNSFLLFADRDLISDIFQEILTAWKGF